MNRENLIAQVKKVHKTIQQQPWSTEEHDIRIVENTPETGFPLIWELNKNKPLSWFWDFQHTVNDFKLMRRSYWDYAESGEYPWSWLWKTFREDTVYFIVDKNGIYRMESADQLEKAVRSAFDPIISMIENANR